MAELKFGRINFLKSLVKNTTMSLFVLVIIIIRMNKYFREKKHFQAQLFILTILPTVPNLKPKKCFALVDLTLQRIFVYNVGKRAQKLRTFQPEGQVDLTTQIGPKKLQKRQF